MEKSKLKQIIRDLKAVVSELESEVYSDTSKYLERPQTLGFDISDNDDDGFPD